MDYSPLGSVSMGFFRQEYWIRLPFSSPGDLPRSGIEPMSPALAGRFFTHEPPGKVLVNYGKMNLLLKNKIKVANIYNNIKNIYVCATPDVYHVPDNMFYSGYLIKG